MLIAHMPSEHIQLGVQPHLGSTESGLHANQGSKQTAAAAATAAKPGQQNQQQDNLQQHHQPPLHQQQGKLQQQQQQQCDGVDCAFMLANAAMYGDSFSWHVDADPQVFPEPSTWTQQYGLYCNR